MCSEELDEEEEEEENPPTGGGTEATMAALATLVLPA
jgi:hypothetical protein